MFGVCVQIVSSAQTQIVSIGFGSNLEFSSLKKNIFSHFLRLSRWNTDVNNKQLTEAGTEIIANIERQTRKRLEAEEPV